MGKRGYKRRTQNFGKWIPNRRNKWPNHIKNSWFQTFAVSWMLYAFFWVIPRRLNFICQLQLSLCTCLTQLYLMVEEYILLLHKVQLHVSALDNDHLQVVHEILSKQLYETIWVVYSGEVYMPTFRNTLSVPSSWAGTCLWRWNRVFRNVGI